MTRCLIDRQSDLIKSGYFNDSSAPVAVDVVVGKVAYDLTQSDHIFVSGLVLGEVIFVDCYFLVWRGLTSFYQERGAILVACEEIVVNIGT